MLNVQIIKRQCKRKHALNELVNTVQGASTLASSFAALCRYCQSIQVPRLFITLSWIFSCILW